jgi:hypothetical protein
MSAFCQNEPFMQRVDLLAYAQVGFQLEARFLSLTIAMCHKYEHCFVSFV